MGRDAGVRVRAEDATHRALSTGAVGPFSGFQGRVTDSALSSGGGQVDREGALRVIQVRSVRAGPNLWPWDGAGRRRRRRLVQLGAVTPPPGTSLPASWAPRELGPSPPGQAGPGPNPAAGSKPAPDVFSKESEDRDVSQPSARHTACRFPVPLWPRRGGTETGSEVRWRLGLTRRASSRHLLPEPRQLCWVRLCPLELGGVQGACPSNGATTGGGAGCVPAAVE